MSATRPPDFFDPLSMPATATVPALADGTDEIVLESDEDSDGASSEAALVSWTRSSVS